jgi:hypothetical protein
VGLPAEIIVESFGDNAGVELLIDGRVAVVGDLDELVNIKLTPDVLPNHLFAAVAGFQYTPGGIVIEVIRAIEIIDADRWAPE